MRKPVMQRSGGSSEDVRRCCEEKAMSSFGLYIIGAIVLIAGLAYAAWLVHMPSQWIAAGGVVLLGGCILGAVTHTRRRDPPA
jgi:hypothetical protein